MAETLWAAIALVLVVEGLMPLLAPRVWRDTFRRLIEMSDGQVRFIGLASIALGLIVYTVFAYA
ncbi:MAG: DUF2065 domain-containing protein [Vicinamibacteria bacterium]|jgi:hypothetical protein